MIKTYKSVSYTHLDVYKRQGLDEYIIYGGLPLITTFKTSEEKIDYLNFQKDNVYINDVIERNDIRNDEELKTCLLYTSYSNKPKAGNNKLPC